MNKKRAEMCGDMLSLEEFKEGVKCSGLMDSDGYGHPVTDGVVDFGIEILPSRRVPDGIDSVLWFNM